MKYIHMLILHNTYMKVSKAFQLSLSILIFLTEVVDSSFLRGGGNTGNEISMSSQLLFCDWLSLFVNV